MDLLKEYPPMIWNPTQGKHILARWWTYEEQHHVIMSTDQAGALVVFKAVMDKEREIVELRQYVEATLVPCPLDIAMQWAEAQYRYELHNFKNWVLFLADDTYVKTQKLPDILTHCPHQENSRARWECPKCEGLRSYFAPGGLEALFDVPEVRSLYRKPPAPIVKERTSSLPDLRMEKYRLEQAAKEAKRPKAVPAILTTDPLPLPDLPLRVAVLNGGHHHPGVEFLDAEEWVKHPGTTPVLFFFQGTDTTVPAPFRDLIAAEKKAVEEEEKRKKAEYKANHRDMKQESVDMLARVVGAYSAAALRR